MKSSQLRGSKNIFKCTALCLAIGLSLGSPAAAIAEDYVWSDEMARSGDGTYENPYVIGAEAGTGEALFYVPTGSTSADNYSATLSDGYYKAYDGYVSLVGVMETGSATLGSATLTLGGSVDANGDYTLNFTGSSSGFMVSQDPWSAVTVSGDIILNVSYANITEPSIYGQYGVLADTILSDTAATLNFNDVNVTVENVRYSVGTRSAEIIGMRLSNANSGFLTVTANNVTLSVSNIDSVYSFDSNTAPLWSIEGVNPWGSETTITGAITVTASNVMVDKIAGALLSKTYNNDQASSMNVNSVSVTASDITYSSTRVHGVMYSPYNTYSSVSGNVMVTVSNSTVAMAEGLFTGAGALGVNGDIAVNVTDSATDATYGVRVAGGDYTQTGAISLTLKGLKYNSTFSTYIAGASVYGPGTYDNAADGWDIDCVGAATVDFGTGEISISLASGSTVGDVSENIYGVAIASNASETLTSFKQSGAINVSLAGQQDLLQQTGTIWGFVDATKSNYSHGTTTLTFGADGNPFVTDDYQGIFTNFDSVEVRYGSSLVITNNQPSEVGSDDIIFGDAIASEFVSGVRALGGVLTVPEGDSFYIDGESSAEISRMDNAGTVTNEGTLKLSGSSTDPNTNTGTINNSGVMRATYLTNSGTVTSSGTLYGITLLTNTGSVENSGLMASSAIANSKGTITNTSTGQMASALLTMAGGTLTNAGNLALAAFTITEEATVSNSGFLIGALSTISDGSVESTGTLVLLDNTLADSGEITVTDGELIIPNTVSFSLDVDFNGDQQSYTSDSVSVKGGTFSGGILKVTGNGTAEIAVSSDTPTINSKIYVSGKLGIGDTAATIKGTFAANQPLLTATTGTDPNEDSYATANSPLQIGRNMWDDDEALYNNLAGETLPDNSLTLTSPVTTGENGYIQVGGTYNDPTGLDFESNSTLVLPYTLYESNTEDSPVIAFTADTDNNATALNVASGASIVMGVYLDSSTKMTGDWYAITKNYSASADAVWTNGNVTVLDEYGEQWGYEVGISENGEGQDVVYLYRTSDEPTVGLCELGYVACHNIRTDINADDPTPGAEAVKNIVGDTSTPIEQRVAAMNSIANLPFAGGVIGTAMSDLNGAITDLNNHLTMDSDTFGAHGVMWPYQEYNNLWLDVNGTWYNQKHLKASGIDRAGWRASAFGFILGYDRKLKDRPVAIGGAFSFTGGNVKSTGNISYTKNKYQDYGLHLWSNYSPNEHLNVIGALHWMHNVSDVTQSIGGIAGYDKAHGHMNTDWLAIGVRFETSLSAGKFTFVPHIEPRYVYSKIRDFNTQIDGQDIWRTHAKGNSFFQIPLGIAARADFLTESGWTIRPNADVTITPQAGSTKLRTELRNDYNAVDAVEGQFMGKFQTAVKLGVQVDKKAWTFGAKYGLVAGDRGRIDHGFIIQTRLRF